MLNGDNEEMAQKLSESPSTLNDLIGNIDGSNVNLRVLLYSIIQPYL